MKDLISFTEVCVKSSTLNKLKNACNTQPELENIKFSILNRCYLDFLLIINFLVHRSCRLTTNIYFPSRKESFLRHALVLKDGLITTVIVFLNYVTG